MTEQSEHKQQQMSDNKNYNSRKNFLRGEATLEPVATDSNVNQTQSIVNEQLDPDSRQLLNQTKNSVLSEKSNDGRRPRGRSNLRSNSKPHEENIATLEE